MAAVAKVKSVAPLKDLYDIGEISAARPRARKDARLGDPQGAPRATRQIVPARSGADLDDR